MHAITVRAYTTDEGFGYDRWRGEEYSCGRGTHDAVLIILAPGESTQTLVDRLYTTLQIREANYAEKCTLAANTTAGGNHVVHESQ